MAELRLVIFDVDGTLVDSQNDIVDAMNLAFEGGGITPPPRGDILGIVGLSLQVAFERLAPGVDAVKLEALIEGYKLAFMTMRKLKASTQSSPLYPGAREAIERLHSQDHILLGVATGKSRRGLDHLLDAHELRPFFVTTQVADDHPSKPHPSMLEQCLRDTGVELKNSVMIGDTSYDMDMASNAGMASIGVSWGYHTTTVLKSRARHMIDHFSELDAALDRIWGVPT